MTPDGISKQFHFGVDVSAPNGTPVYATLTGVVSIHPLHQDVVLIDASGGVEFSYWHIIPIVHGGERAVAYETVIGRVERPWAHVHFSELASGVTSTLFVQERWGRTPIERSRQSAPSSSSVTAGRSASLQRMEQSMSSPRSRTRHQSRRRLRGATLP